MKKSANLNLQAYTGSKNYDYEYSDDFPEANENAEIPSQLDFSMPKKFSEPIETQSAHFKVRNFPETKISRLPPQDDSDYDLSSLNTPLIPQNERLLQPVDAIFLMVASPSHFPSTESDYLRGKPLIYMWKDQSNILSNTFSQYIQSYFKEQYGKIRSRLRFYFQVDPTSEKLNNSNTIRKDVQGGRILYHYIGYGFPRIDESYIYSVDPKNSTFVNYPIKVLFENIKPPAWLIFDCSNASAVLNTLESTAIEKINSPNEKSSSSSYVRSVDWKDWFCLCATDVNEDLPIDPHLPRDFLTSCLLTPVRMAVLCHIIQYYRTTIVDDNFPLGHINSPLLSEDSPLYLALEQTLSAITDAIAVDSLPPEVFRQLFRKDFLTMVLFQRFLLSQYLLKPFQVHPRSNPQLPDLSPHPLWHHWRTIVDMSVSSILSPKPSFATDLFVRANESFRGFLDRKEESFITPALLMLLFHTPEGAKYRDESFILLAEYAATSEAARNLLSRTALFNTVFDALVLSDNIKSGLINNNSNSNGSTESIETVSADENSNENNYDDSYELKSDDEGFSFEAVKSASQANNNNIKFDIKVFHSLLYLVISLLQNSPQFVNDIRHEFDVTSFPHRLFDESLPMYTRTLVAAIIASVLPHLEGIRSVAVSPLFLVSMQKLLETSDAPLSLWALIIQRRMFDSFGSELRNFFSISMHIQVASFAMHSSPEVRAASLATVPCFLEQDSDVSNSQLFGLAMLTAFDASFLVRFNFVLFLSRFLTIYQDRVSGQETLGTFSHQCFRSVVSNWIGNEQPFEELISDFTQMMKVVDSICSKPDFLNIFVRIALLLVDFLVDDPHPSVKSSAIELRNFVQMLNDSSSSSSSSSRQKKKNQLPELSEQGLDPQSPFFVSDFQGPFFDEFLGSSKERPALCESGGDALYKVCMRQVVAAGCSIDLKTEKEDKPVISALPVPLVHQIPSTKIVLKSKTKLDCGKPSICAYNPHSLSLAVGTVTGNVIYQCEEEVSSSSNISSNSILQSPSLPSLNGLLTSSSGIGIGNSGSGIGSLGSLGGNIGGVGSLGSGYSTYNFSCQNSVNSTTSASTASNNNNNNNNGNSGANLYVSNDESNGNLNGNGKFFCHNFGDKVTSLTVTDWSDHSDLLLIGTEDGSAYVWEPRSYQQPQVCFRADAPSKSSSPMPLLMSAQQPNKIVTARGNNGTIRLWDICTQKVVGEWVVGGSQAFTALTISPSDPNVCVSGFLNGLIVTIDLRITSKSGPTNVDAPCASQRILRIVGNNSAPTLYWAGTSKGNLMKWETLNNLDIVNNGAPLVDFDVHPTNPFAVLSPSNSSPFITDTDMKVLHQVKNIEHGSVCRFHPALPVISFAAPSGEILQYELVSGK